MSVVLNWVKANVFTVIFVVVMLAAVIVLPILSGGLNKSLRADVKSRAAKDADLDRLAKTELKIPTKVPGDVSIDTTVLVNQKLLDRYKEVVHQRLEDADLIQARALQHNRKDRSVLLDEMFPTPPPDWSENLAYNMRDELRRAYDQLLMDVRGGARPAADDLKEDLQRRDRQFRSRFLGNKSMDELTDEEKQRLRDELIKTRLSKYREAAQEIGFYVTLDSLAHVPALGRDDPPSPILSRWFSRQWDLWICQDVLGALSEANGGSISVIDAPVKRVLYMNIMGEIQGVAAESAPAGRGGLRGGGNRGKSGDKAGAGAKPDPKKEAPIDYAASFTGRRTNSLYDVRVIELDLVVETARVPQVLDALSAHNFITVTSLEMEPVDAFGHASQGYLYGPVAVSVLKMELETVWLRDWTVQFMPDDIKRALGIPIDQPQQG